MLLMRRISTKIRSNSISIAKEKRSKNKRVEKLPKQKMDIKSGTLDAGFRNWYNFKDVKAKESNRFTLVSYNILSQDLLNEHMHLYVGIDPTYLSWEHRLNKLRAEIFMLKPDILCLQEMQYNHINHFMLAIDTENKFEYIFKKKTGSRSDGCAIMYNRRKFRLLDEYTVEYYQSPLSPYNRENIGLIAKLRTKEREPKTFLVATTHLLYNPRREDVRLAQLNVLLGELERRSLESGERNQLPIILTGDFNSEPFTLPHRLLTAGVLRSEEIPMTLESKTLSHCLDLYSAYDEKNASTFQNNWIIVDYIFYSGRKTLYNIKVLCVFELPTKSLCCKMGKIPNHTLGSDHLSQAIVFSIENPKDKSSTSCSHKS